MSHVPPPPPPLLASTPPTSPLPALPRPSPACLQMKEEEEKNMKEVKVVDGVKRVVEKLLARRKLKRGGSLCLALPCLSEHA